MRGHGAGVEIHQACFGIMALVDGALLPGHRRLGSLAIGGIGCLFDKIATGVRDNARR